MTEIKEEVKKVAKATASTKVKPEVKTFVGEIVDLNPLRRKNADGSVEELGLLMKFNDVENGKTISVITSEGQITQFQTKGQSYDEFIKATPQCEIEVNVNIENVTGYNDDGNWKLHQSSGFSLNNITPLGMFRLSSINAVNSEKAKLTAQMQMFEQLSQKKVEMLMKTGMSYEDAAKAVALA